MIGVLDLPQKNKLHTSAVLGDRLGTMIFVFLALSLIFLFVSRVLFLDAVVLFMFILLITAFKTQDVREIYNPILLFTVINFIMFGFASLFVQWYPEEYYRYDIDVRVLSNGMMHIFLCYTFIIFGYHVASRKNFVSTALKKIIVRLPDINKYYVHNLIGAVILFEILGWISRLLVIRLGAYFFIEAAQSALITQYTSFMLVITIGSQLPLYAITILIIRVLEAGDRKYLALTIILFLLEVIYYLPTGSKEQIFFPFFLLLIVYSVLRKTPVKTMIIGGILAIVIIFPITAIYRNVFVRLESVIDIFNLASLYQYYLSNLDVGDLFFNVFGVRLNSSAMVSVLVDKTPEVWDFRMGSDYLYLFISFIPRIIWPGKPLEHSGLDFGVAYGLNRAGDFDTAVAYTWIGETFLNFGWVGFIVAFGYGVLYRFIYDYFFHTKKITNLGLLFYTATLYIMVRGDQFAGQFSGLFKLLLVLLILSIPFIRKVPQTE